MSFPHRTAPQQAHNGPHQRRQAKAAAADELHDVASALIVLPIHDQLVLCQIVGIQVGVQESDADLVAREDSLAQIDDPVQRIQGERVQKSGGEQGCGGQE